MRGHLPPSLPLPHFKASPNLPTRGFPKHINPSNALSQGNAMAKNSQGVQKGLESFKEGKNPFIFMQRPPPLTKVKPSQRQGSSDHPCSTPAPGPEHPSPFPSLEVTQP